MIRVIKFHIDDQVYTVRKLNFGWEHQTNLNGTISAKGRFLLFEMEIETPPGTHLYAWAVAPNMMKQARLVMSDASMNSRSRIFDLYDTYCVSHYDYFDAYGPEPMVTRLKMIPGIIVGIADKPLETDWKITDLNKQKVADTPLPKEPEKPTDDVVDFHLENPDGTRADDYYIGDEIDVVITTKEMIGKTVEIPLDNEGVDFEYNGQVLKDDKLIVTITSDIQRERVKVLNPTNQS